MSGSTQIQSQQSQTPMERIQLRMNRAVSWKKTADKIAEGSLYWLSVTVFFTAYFTFAWQHRFQTQLYTPKQIEQLLYLSVVSLALSCLVWNTAKVVSWICSRKIAMLMYEQEAS
jgi:hypothetical protein